MSVIIKAENLTFSYGAEPFIDKLNTEIDEGEFVSVVGGNGSGKTTFLSLLTGVQKPQSGAVLYKNNNIHKIKNPAREIAVIYQNADCSFPFSCHEIIEMGLYPHMGRMGKISDSDYEFIEEIMIKTDTLKFADKRITELSGGEKQRVLLARALVQKPKLLFLDEAMSGMDISVRLAMIKLLKEMVTQNGLTVVAVEHDLQLAFSASDRIIAMKNGQIAYHDAPSDIMNETFFKDVFNVKAEIQNNSFKITDVI